ncbi:unnamed protein product [Sphagnum balticum]
MYTETEFEKLIKSVETEFSAHLAEVENNFKLESLAKAEDGGKKPPEKKEDGKEKEAKPEGEKAPEGKEAAPAAPAEGAEAKPEGEQPAAAPAAAAPAQGGAHDYDDEDLAHMEKMYMSMSPGELKAHHDCIAKIAKCGGMESAAPVGPAGPLGADSNAQPAVQKSELNAHGAAENPPQPKVKGENLDSDPANGGIEGQKPANALGPKSPASDANGAKMGKSEHARRNGGKIEEQAPHNSPGAKSPASKAEGVQMQKSENADLELAKAETAAANAKVENLQKSLDAVSAFITKLVEKRVAPQGKAITSLDVIAKSEGTQEDKSLSKGEIDAKLLSKAQDPKLEKSDRDLINSFYLNGGSVNSISHLLK